MTAWEAGNACGSHDQLVQARGRREDTVWATCGAQVSQTGGSTVTEGLVDECREARESHQR